MKNILLTIVVLSLSSLHATETKPRPNPNDAMVGTVITGEEAKALIAKKAKISTQGKKKSSEYKTKK